MLLLGLKTNALYKSKSRLFTRPLTFLVLEYLACFIPESFLNTPRKTLIIQSLDTKIKPMTLIHITALLIGAFPVIAHQGVVGEGEDVELYAVSVEGGGEVGRESVLEGEEGGTAVAED